MMTMKLYHRPDCPFCWKVRLFLQEENIKLEEVCVDLGETHPDVVALNPNGTVPVLVDGDVVLGESAVIIEYLADKFPGSSLMKGSPSQRAQIRQLHYDSDHKLGKIIFPYIKQIRESEQHKASDDLLKKTSEAWAREQKKLTRTLGEKAFFNKEFSVAECALIPRFALALAYGLTLNEDDQNLKQWFYRCVKRPSFLDTLPQALPAIDEMVKF